MAKMLLMSVLFATLIIPMSIAREGPPTRGLKRSNMGFSGFVFAWGFACIYIYFRIK
jgi:hypothetical protein